MDPGVHFSDGAPPSALCGSGLGFAGASCASVPDNAFLYHGFDDSSEKGDFSKAFHEVVTLITGLFLHVKPSFSSSSVESFPWMDICGPSSRDSWIFLSRFDKMPALSKEMNEKFWKVADETKMSTALPHWGDVYHLGDRPDLYKAPKVNESFSSVRCLLS